MRYYIIFAGKVFTTKWFDAENNFSPGMIVIDSITNKYYMGGKWVEMEFDHL